jgi:hypothetical protein
LTPETIQERLNRCEAALKKIADSVEDQLALEGHQQRVGLPLASVDLGRLDAYRKIVWVAGEALGRMEQAESKTTH